MRKLICLKRSLILVLGMIVYVVANINVQAATLSDFNNPRIVIDRNMRAGQKVTYDCIYFGSYPQTELVLASNKNANSVTEYETLTSEEFAKLTSATYDTNGDATVTLSTGSIRVRRMTKRGATYNSTSSGYYNWTDSTSCHYFRYDPIKWRVLSVDEDGNALVRADKGLDCQRYYSINSDVTWETSTIRSWLNTADNGFLKTAFTDEEKAAINITTVENKNNLYYGASGGKNTKDKVFLLSESEVYSTDTAVSYGFAKGDWVDDEARQVQPSTYAYAMGAYRSTDSSYAGNSKWLLRSPGHYSLNVAYVSDSGDVDRGGTDVYYTHYYAVCPALKLNLSSDLVKSGCQISTDGIVHDLSSWTQNSNNINKMSRRCKTQGCDFEEEDCGPIRERDRGADAKQKVAYGAIYFGSYPQTELVLAGSAEFIALENMNDAYVTEYDVLSSDEFSKLTSAKYDTKGDATVSFSTGDVKVRRVKKGDATVTYSSSAYYNWSNSTNYHYFRYDPIKWRVLSVDEDGNALVRADKGLDDQKYNTSNTSVTWETSTIRSWLNTADNGFLNTAFTDEEKAVINATVENNLPYGTNGGNNTEDKVFLLSNSEVYGTDTAVSYGFVMSYSTYDEARRVQPSTYAYAMGAGKSIDSAYVGNSYWWLRSPGYRTDNAACVGIDGYVYNTLGNSLTTDHNAVCPALNLNLSSHYVKAAGTVSTDGTKQEVCPVTGLEHNEVITTEAVAVTCEVRGLTEETGCSNCGQVLKLQKTIQPLGHIMSDRWTIVIPATETISGVREKVCTREGCGEKIVELYIIDGATTVIVPEGTLSINANAFKGCSSLTDVTIPASVTEIGDEAFKDCTNLRRIKFEGDIKNIKLGKDVFKNTANEVAQLRDTEYFVIDGVLLSASTNASSITIPETVEVINDYVFANNVTARQVTFPSKLTKINDNAFNGSAIMSATLPETLTYIGDNAFSNCKSLSSITLPDNLEYLGDLENATALDSITVPEKIEVIHSFSGTKFTSILFKGEPKEFEEGCFRNCTTLTNINIPNSIINIPNDLFEGCSSLSDITIPDSVQEMGTNVFSGCNSLSSITIPFVGKRRVTASDVNQYPLGYIFGTSSYSYATSATQKYYGDTVGEVESTAYYLPNTLKTVNVTDCDYIPYGAFCNCNKLTTITVPQRLTSISAYTFSGCSSLTSVNTPNDVTEIGKEAYSGCSSLRKTEIPVGITEIPYKTYYGCSSLTEVKIPNSVKSIGVQAFSGCSKLTYVDISENALDIKSGAFENCKGLKTVDLPSNIEVLEENVFNGSGLTQIGIPAHVTTIKEKAFYNTAITDLIIPASVTTIATDSFSTTKIKTIHADRLEQIVDLDYGDYLTKVFLDTDATDPITNMTADEVLPGLFKNSIASQMYVLYPPDTNKGWNNYAKSTSYSMDLKVEPWNKITYMLNGGENNPKNPIGYYGDKVNLYAPTKEKKHFLGWYEDEKCTKEITEIAADSGENRTIYAAWCGEQIEHDYTAVGNIPATCVEKGKKLYECKKCFANKIVTDDSTTVVNHKYLWKTTKVATPDSDGSKEGKCIVCGKLKTTNTICVKKPRIQNDSSLTAKQLVTYDTICFGSYPQTELVLADSIEAIALAKMNTNYTTEYETLSSEEFLKLTSASYNINGDATVTLGTDDIKVRRIKKSDATYGYSYNWLDSTSYHYFRYDPIKWKVLSVDEEGNALVRADRGLDDQKYNTSRTSVTWETSTIRNWLNTADNGFLNTAFTDEEKAVINTTTVENKNNLYYGTNGGNNTEDKVFLLSESEVYSTDTAASYGFVKSDYTYDEARRLQPSTYAYAMGAYRDTRTSYAGNSYWWLRSPGYYTGSAAYVRSDGYVNDDDVNCSVSAVCPALNLNLTSPLVVNGGTVNTDGSGCEEHEWHEDYTIDIAPTCTKIGIKSIHCKFCDAKKEVVSEKMLAHEYTTITSQVDATCAKEGYKKYKCTNCNQTITETIEKTEHNWIKKPSYCVASTCAETGYDYFACQVCYTTKKETIDKLPHNWASDFTIDKKPTCTQEGSKSIHCKACDATKDVTAIEKNEHTYNNYEIESFDEGDTTFVETRRCVFCGNKDSRTQNITELIPSGTGAYLNADDEVNYSGFKETPKIIICRDGKILRDGIDYKIAYSNNLNATINPTKPAKYTINYKGDYKKVKKEVFTFTIEQGNMEDTTIVCGDMINYSKPGVFKSKPYVDLNGFVLKTSDYTISYWLDEECTIPMDSKHKFTIEDGEEYGTAYVKVTGKYKNMIGEKVGSYRVYRKPDKYDTRTNITKCKLQLDPVTKKGLLYSGDGQYPDVDVILGKEPVTRGYYVDYVGNIQKGTATIFVTGDGTHAVGTKTINFKIK